MGGLGFGRLGRRPPETGEAGPVTGYLLRVEEVDGSRIARVLVRKEPS